MFEKFIYIDRTITLFKRKPNLMTLIIKYTNLISLQPEI